MKTPGKFWIQISLMLHYNINHVRTSYTKGIKGRCTVQGQIMQLHVQVQCHFLPFDLFFVHYVVTYTYVRTLTYLL